ncbi:MAG TPA: hypothetical protein EYP10_08340 [Armatimonadetes bacterium]|nr:hypothetical protein [Armatimonadota bacterium]
MVVAHARLDRVTQSAFLWLVITFAALLSLPRIFAREEDKGTAVALRMMAMPSAVFIAKWLFNAGFTTMIAIVLYLLAIPLWQLHQEAQVAWISVTIFTLALSTLSITVAGTFLGALIAKVQRRASLMGIIAFPALLPALVPAVHCTNACLSKHPIPIAQLVWLALYAMLTLVLSLMLFEHVWRD